MADPVVAQQSAGQEAQAQVEAQPKVEVSAQPQAQAQPEVKQEDLITRVSKTKPEVKEEHTNPFGLSKDDYDKVQNDPTLSKFYKSMQSDYIKKTQEVAEEKKKLAQPQPWTIERLQQEISKPDFIQAAQVVSSMKNPNGSGLSDAEYSTLTQTEKAQLQESIQRSKNLEGQLFQMQQKQQDDVLSQKYGNYAPDIVDRTISQLVRGEIKADREVIYKALYHDENVRNAYELGKKDAQQGLKEKQQASSPEGFNAIPLNEPLPRIQGENDRAYFKRIGERRLSELKGSNK